MKTCLKAKSMVDVTVFISVRFYACMHVHIFEHSLQMILWNVKKKMWENAELKVKKYVPVHPDLSLTMNI